MMPIDPPPCSRSSSYRPLPPEAQSRLSRCCVIAECAAALLLVAVVLAQLYRPLHERPVQISSRLAVPEIPSHLAGLAVSAEELNDGPDADMGQVLYRQSCTSCHGQEGQGLPQQGVNLRISKFIAEKSDRQLVAFLKNGREAIDPKNTTGLFMPARGGNVSLDDEALADIVAFLRQVQYQETAKAAGEQR